MSIPQLYDVKAVAEKLNVSERTLMRAIKSNSLAAVRIGGWKLSEDQVLEYIQKRSTKAIKKY